MWEEGAQAQVLRVSPFAPHKAAAAAGAAALGDPAHRMAQAEELGRVQVCPSLWMLEPRV